MRFEVKLKSTLIRAGLSEKAAELYLYIQSNSKCCVADACIDLKYGKSSVYRAFEELKQLGLVSSVNENWKNVLEVNSLGNLIKKLENDKRKKANLINTLRAIEFSQGLKNDAFLAGFETLNEEETFERYHDLSKREDWHIMMAFGNWEDFNNENRCIVPVEKQFIRNRLRHGGKALVVVTKEGPNTSQIVDYNEELDLGEDRKSVAARDLAKKSLWVNVFEGNDHVHIWNMNRKQEIQSTFMECASVADFYKDFIYSKLI